MLFHWSSGWGHHWASVPTLSPRPCRALSGRAPCSVNLQKWSLPPGSQPPFLCKAQLLPGHSLTDRLIIPQHVKPESAKPALPGMSSYLPRLPYPNPRWNPTISPVTKYRGHFPTVKSLLRAPNPKPPSSTFSSSRKPSRITWGGSLCPPCSHDTDYEEA